MKYSFVALALAALAQAQTRADIPSCALPCLDAAVTANTKCSTSDYVCICKDFDVVQAQATSCVIQKCGTDVAINKVLPATQALCAANSGSGSGSSAANTTPAKETTSAKETSAAQTSAAQTSAAQSSSVASAPPSSTPVSSAPAQTTPAGNKTTTGAPTAPTSGSSTILPGLALVAALCAFAL
ncbi:uncharacterized protein TRIVIDRAFT_92810 [Trichoderma virens Gv29-8]|uniref:CFEM domain-containing protein n=1 Tax=Hypocrea virens (strain Gv29-8 / FGSC 10586) TaxID=413071 RepID=G9N192_HYPVG|nr:uncharacterized protein TRIVIDRAFT_92810 [Trichoderma virens Gv29-8]EHK19700.1 hypothetical protein TRIVIDRAFT_92810 [Trichoderma virens Gv29-8]